MPIPLRATNFQLSSSWPRRIILHHTACKVSNAAEFMLDKPTFQTGKLLHPYCQRCKGTLFREN